MIFPDFDPAAPNAEQEAWAAGLSLADPPEEWKIPLEDGSNLADHARNVYNSYYDHRIQRGLQPFPTRRAESSRDTNTALMRLYGGEQAGAPLSPVERDVDEQMLKIHEWAQTQPDPVEAKAKSANATFFKTLAGREVPAEQLGQVAEAYGRQEFGLEGPVTHKQLYDKIQTRFSEDRTDAGFFRESLNRAIVSRLGTIGKPDAPMPTLDERDKLLEGVRERNRQPMREQWMESQAEITRLSRKAQPLVEHIQKFVEQAAAGKGTTEDPERALRDVVNTMTRWLPDNKEERAMVLGMLANRLEAMPEDQRGWLRRMSGSFDRGIYTALDSILMAGQAEMRQVVKGIPYGDPETFDNISAEATENLQRRSELLNTILGSGMKLETAADGFFAKSGLYAAQSAWMMPAAFHPAGQLAIQQSMTGDSIARSRRDYPDMPEGLRTNAALVSGTAQAVVEVITDTTAAKILLGRLPTFTGLLNKMGVTSKLGRAALGAGAGGATVWTTEYTEEMAQGATDKLVQGLAADLSGLKPEYNWTEYFANWFGRQKNEDGSYRWGLGQEQLETMLAVSGFAMIAGAGASYNHFKYGRALQQNKTFLRAMGMTETEVRDITNTTNLDEAAERTRAAFDLAQQRAMAMTDEEKTRLADLRTQAIEVLQASNQALAETDAALVVPEGDQYVFIEPETGTRKPFATENEALEAWMDWKFQQEQGYLDTVEQAAHKDFLKSLIEPGAMAEGTKVTDTGRTNTLADEQAAAEGKVAEAEKGVSAATKDGTARDLRAAEASMDRATRGLKALKARIEVYLYANGISAENAPAALKNVVIKAKSFASYLQGKVVGYTVELYNGHKIEDIAEDLSETAMKRAFGEGWADPELVLDDIRRYEAASGNRVLDPAYRWDSENAVPLIEAVSALARGRLLNNVRTGMLPPSVQSWLQIQTAILAASVDLAKAGAAGHWFARDVKTAGELKRALEAGHVPPRLERMLNDSLGLDPDAKQVRLERQAERQVAAAARGDVVDLQTTLQGQLPHPQTLRDNYHPLADAMQRIWEALQRPIRAITQTGAGVNRNNEANAFFQPVGKMTNLAAIREMLELEGFDFDTPADMLEALEVAITFGRPFYADTFSMQQDKVSAMLDQLQSEARLGLSVQTPKGERWTLTASLADESNREFGQESTTFSLSRAKISLVQDWTLQEGAALEGLERMARVEERFRKWMREEGGNIKGIARLDEYLAKHPEDHQEIRDVERLLDGKVKLLGDDGGLIRIGIETSLADDGVRPSYARFSRSFSQLFLDRLDGALFRSIAGKINRAMERLWQDKKALPDSSLPVGFKKTVHGTGLASIAHESAELLIQTPIRLAEKTVAALNLNSACPMFVVGNRGCWGDACYLTRMAKAATGTNLFERAMYAGEILQWKDEEIRMINEIGGLRVNGVGDTTPDNVAQLETVIRHAGMRGLKIKMITKQELSIATVAAMRARGMNVDHVLIQPSVDYYWRPVEMDLEEDTAGAREIAGGSVVALARLLQTTDLEKGRDTGELLAAIYDNYGREVKQINGRWYRKDGFSWRQFLDLAARYPGVKLVPRVIVGSVAEIMDAATRHPGSIITLMHGKLGDGLISDFSDKQFNFNAARHHFKWDAKAGEIRVRSNGIRGEEGQEKGHKALEEHINSTHDKAQRFAIYHNLRSQTCCQENDSKDACADCASHCALRQILTPTQKAKTESMFPLEKPGADENPEDRLDASYAISGEDASQMNPVASHMDALRLYAEGKTLYAFHEMDEDFSEVTSLNMLNNYGYDDLMWTETPEDVSYAMSSAEVMERIKAIRAMPAIHISTETIQPREARELYEKLGRSKLSDGREVVLVKGVYGKLEGHQNSAQILRLVPQFKELLESALPAYEEGVRDAAKYHNLIAYHNVVAKAGLDGRDYFVRFTIQEVKKPDGNEFHNAALSDVAMSEATVADIHSGIIDPASISSSGLDKPLIRWMASVNPQTTGESYAMSDSALHTLDDAIMRRMTRGPDERIEYYERLRDRLAATQMMARQSKRNSITGQGEAEVERNRIRDALAESAAILKALPAAARGKVGYSMQEVIDAKTEAGQITALVKLLDRADAALEDVLLEDYHEAFEKLLDLAKPDLKQNRQLRGRLTPDTQKLIGWIQDAVVEPPEGLVLKLAAKQGEIDALEATTPTTPEEIKAAQAQLIELYEQQHVLETFGALAQLDSARLATAYEQLQAIYTTGRTTRRIMDEARKQRIKDERDELLAGMPRVDDAKHKLQMADTGLGDSLSAFRLGMSSFHQLMEWMFPNSQTARAKQQLVRKADRAFTRAKLAAKDRWDRFTFGTWNLTGVGANRKRNGIIAKLSTLREDWGITLQEGITFAKEKLTEEQAEAILAGKMQTGWETDPIAMTSLRQAVADFRLQRLKAQNEDRAFMGTVIRFKRLTGRGQPGAYVGSDMMSLYLLQLYAQEQYRPALDRYGFTEAVMQSIESKMDPRALQVGDFLRGEYDAEWGRLNPVYRDIYGLDMPKIRNYAPGLFEHQDARAGGDGTIDVYGDSAPVSAMSNGFTKSRTHHMARPKTTNNALAGYWSHLEAAEYFIAYGSLMRDMRQIFRDPETRWRIEGNYGKKIADLFSNWLDALEVDGQFRAVEMQELAQLSQRMVATQAAVGLAFNIGVLLKQLPAAIGFLMHMPPKQAFVGLVRAFQNPKSLKSIWSSETVQQRVLAGISPEDRRMLAASATSPSLIYKLLDIGRLPIAYADAVFTTLSASVAYNYHLGEATKAGLSPDLAAEFALAQAALVIERTAQPATTQDKSMAELTAKGFAKFLYLFKSEPRKNLAIAWAGVADAKSGRGTKANAARKVLTAWVLQGLLNQLMSDIALQMFRDKDDPDDWSWKDYLAAAIAGPLNAIPIIGSAMEYGIRKLAGGQAYVNSINPFDAGMARAVSIIPRIYKEVTDGLETKMNLNEALTLGQQAAASLAMVAGAADPRVAIVPAVLRLLRDIQGAAANALEVINGPSADDQALEIARELGEGAKEEKELTTERRQDLIKELAKLEPEARNERMKTLSKKDRLALKAVFRTNALTPSERAIRALPKEQRHEAVKRITAGMSEGEAAAYRARLKRLKVD